MLHDLAFPLGLSGSQHGRSVSHERRSERIEAGSRNAETL
jgi:hypothetical protein